MIFQKLLRKKSFWVTVILLLVCIAGYNMVMQIVKSSFSYTRAPVSSSTAEMIDKATLIVQATPIGRREVVRVDAQVRFVLTTLQVSGMYEGDEQTTIQLLQTEGFEPDIPLQNNQTYVLLLEPYEMGSATIHLASKLEGTYKCVDAYYGAYMQDAKGNLTALSLPDDDTSQQTDTVSSSSGRASAVQAYLNSK